MNITRTEKDELNSVISLKINVEDYEPKVNSELKEYRKKAQIKGFRPGKAPIGLIKKMVGNQIVMQEVDKLVSESLTKYLIDEKLDILGQPLPSDKQQPVDIINETEHEFLFDVGLAPKIDLTIDKKTSIPYYKIKIDDKLINDEIERHRNQFAKAEKKDTIEGTSYVKGNVIQTDKEGKVIQDGIFSEDTMIATDIIKDEKEKKKFIGAKIDDTVTFDIKKAFPNNTEIAGILKIDKEKVDEIESHFQFVISEITNYVPAEINQELFDKVFANEKIKTEEEYKEKIKANIEKVYKDESEYRLGVDAKEKLLSKSDVKLPEEFMKKWLKATDKEGKLTDEILEKEYPLFEKDTIWQLIKSSISKNQEFKVTEEELRQESRKFTEAQFMQYGLPLNSMSEEQMASFIDKNLEKAEDRNRFAERAVENKVINYIKENAKLEEKAISLDDFKKLYEQK
ncbi:MAG: trigger factor [Bacteroidales bacterium]|nr:trigger factor [Bacteroidales bacterium]